MQNDASSLRRVSPPCRVVADSSDPDVVARADAVAARLRVPRLLYHDVPETDEHFTLVVGKCDMVLHSPDTSIRRGISIDIARHVEQYQRTGLSWRQPLGRSIGANACFVVDATAGLGQDAVTLAMLGHDVLAIERSPVLAVMLDDALATSAAAPNVQSAIGDRLRFREGDARVILREVASGKSRQPDVVMIDPMFPPKRRGSALPRKEMQILRQLVGDDADVDELFAVAREIAIQRVVVKRSDDAPSLVPEPTMTYAGKLVRYDVYKAE